MIVFALAAAMTMAATPHAEAQVRTQGVAPQAAAEVSLQAGRADEAMALANGVLRSDRTNAVANNLLCRVYYALDEMDPAVSACEAAVRASDQTSRYHLWLGRALGEKAGHASFLSAYSLAKRAHQEFERAVALDPHDAEALSDLGEYYEEAPGALGGGLDKAQAMAERLMAVDPTRGREFEARLKDKKGQSEAAEEELKDAIAHAPHPALAWMALASFYQRHQRWEPMQTAVETGASLAFHDRHAAIALYNGATILERTGRRLDLAARMLEAYVASPDRTEEAPAFVALTHLARIRNRMGDHAGAEQARDQALALAHEYRPAQDALK